MQQVEVKADAFTQNRRVEPVGGPDGELPRRRQVEVGVERIDAHVRRTGRDRRHQRVRDVEQRLAAGVGEDVEVTAVHLDVGHAVVRIVVRQPDVGVAARIEAEAAAELQIVGKVIAEAEARLQQTPAVQVRRVVEAVAGHEVGVQGRLVVRVVPVIPQAEGQGQVVREDPFVLGVQGVGAVGEAGRRIVRVQRGRVAVIDDRGVAVPEVVDAVEAELALAVLDEQVEHVQVFALVAEGEQVITPDVRAAQLVAHGLVAEHVRVTRVVGAQEDGGARVDTVAIVVVQGRDLDFTDVQTALRDLTVVQGRIGDAELGREIVRPVREDLQDIGVQLGTALIQVARIFELVRTAVRLRDVEAVIVVIGEGGAVLVGDVPVQLDQQLFVLIRLGSRDATRIEAVNVPGNVQDLVVLGLREALHLGTTAAGRRTVEEVHAFQFFIGGEEIQTVLDDRSAQVHTPAGFLELAQIDRAAFQIGTGQLVVAVVVEETTRQAVAARLGHGVDVTGGEVAVFDVERGQFHGHLLDGVVGEGHTLGRIARRVQAEIVVQADAVDGQAVEARVGAAALHGVNEGFVDIDARVDRDHVADVAVDGRGRGQVFGGEDGIRADGGLDDAAGGADHDDFVQLGAALRNIDVSNRRVANADSRDFTGARNAAGVNLDRVGAADAQAAGVVLAIGAGDGNRSGARRHVGHSDRGVGDRLAAVAQHGATDGAGGFLGMNRGGRGHHEYGDRGPVGELLQHVWRIPADSPRNGPEWDSNATKDDKWAPSRPDVGSSDDTNMTMT